MTKTYQWYYNGSAIGGATGKTHTLTSGQTDSNLIECRTQVDYGTDSVAALAEYAAAATGITLTAMDNGFVDGTAATTKTVTGGTGAGQIDWSLYNDSDDFILAIGIRPETANTTVSTVTVGGNSAAQIISGGATNDTEPTVAFARFTGVTLADTADVVVTTGANITSIGVQVLTASTITSMTQVTDDPGILGNRTQVDVSGSVTAGNAFVAIAQGYDIPAGFTVGGNVTQVSQFDIRSNEIMNVAKEDNSPGGTRGATFDHASQRSAGLSVQVS